jgi:hypothetical protein
MPSPKAYGQVGRPFPVAPRFTPGATSKVAKIDYSLVRTRGTTTDRTHAVAGTYRRRADILGVQTLCGVPVSKTGSLLDYKRPGGPKCKACAASIYKDPS